MPRSIQDFFGVEAASGVLLFAATALALVWANSSLQAHYHAIWRLEVGGMSMLHWMNDALMVLFFLVVGLEIKREIVSGELSSRQKAALPLTAA